MEDALTRWLPASGICDTGRALAGPSERQAGPVTGVFNAEGLLARLMGDRQLADTILKQFIEEFPIQLNNLRRHVDEGNAPGTSREAHTIKGAAATVSAEGLRAVAEAMERAAKAERLDRCDEFLPRILEEFEQFRNTLESGAWV